MRLAAGDPATDVLDRLRDVCRAHRGDRPLFVEVSTGDGLTAVLRAGDDVRISPTAAFLDAVGTLVGMPHVRVLGSRRLMTKPTARPSEATAAAAVEAEEITAA